MFNVKQLNLRVCLFCRYERGFAPNVSLAPASKHTNSKDAVHDISDDEEEKEPAKNQGERSPKSPAAREWDLPSESDDSLHLSDSKFACSHLIGKSICGN